MFKTKKLEVLCLTPCLAWENNVLLLYSLETLFFHIVSTIAGSATGYLKGGWAAADHSK